MQALCQQIPAWIAGKMTAVLQVTDTDVAFRFKAACRRAQADLRRAMKAKAAAQNSRATFRCSHYEVMYVISRAHQEMNSRTRSSTLCWQVAGGTIC